MPSYPQVQQGALSRCAKNDFRYEVDAAFKMEVDPTELTYRSWLQTSVSC
jgi:uncharacterized protein involved in tolerance to divalent cations